MTICSCLACIEGFGRCSSVTVIAESTARGVSSFKPASDLEELQALAVVFGHEPKCVQPWDLCNHANIHTEESV